MDSQRSPAPSVPLPVQHILCMSRKKRGVAKNGKRTYYKLRKNRWNTGWFFLVDKVSIQTTKPYWYIDVYQRKLANHICENEKYLYFYQIGWDETVEAPPVNEHRLSPWYLLKVLRLRTALSCGFWLVEGRVSPSKYSYKVLTEKSKLKTCQP